MLNEDAFLNKWWDYILMTDCITWKFVDREQFVDVTVGHIFLDVR